MQEKITCIEYYTFFWIFIKRVFNQTSQKEKTKIERGNAPGCFWTLLELSAVLPSIVFQYHPNHESSSFILSFPASAASNLKNKKEMFGVVFPNRSFPMDISTFSQIDTFHWVLDMNTFVGKSSSLSVFFSFYPFSSTPGAPYLCHLTLALTCAGEAYDQVRELCIFLLNSFSLPADKALAVYIQSPGSPFLFCGAVTLSRPSAVLSLPWPEPGSGGEMRLTASGDAPLSAKIGVSVEDLAALPSLDVAAEKRIERLAMKVGENLFNFMQSFCGVDGSKLVVPMDILDRWFKKFRERAKRDPEYLKGFAL